MENNDFQNAINVLQDQIDKLKELAQVKAKELGVVYTSVNTAKVTFNTEELFNTEISKSSDVSEEDFLSKWALIDYLDQLHKQGRITDKVISENV